VDSVFIFVTLNEKGAIMRVLSSFILFLFALWMFSDAETVYRNTGATEVARVLTSNQNSVTIEFNLPELTVENEYLFEFGYASKFRIPEGGGVLGEVGRPDLPIIGKYVMIPNTGNVTVEVISEKTLKLGSYNVMPYQYPPSLCGEVFPYEIDKNVYDKSAYFPNSCAKISSFEILRDIRVANVWYCPVRVNPVTNEVLMVTSAVMTLHFTNEKGEHELFRQCKSLTRSFLPIYKKVLNFDTQLSTIPVREEVGCYMFLGSSSTLEAVEEFINWKKRKGYDVVVIDVDTVGGSSASAVDNWIEDAFNTWDNPPEYLFIIGSENVVPAPSRRGAKDHIYGCVTNDRVPDIHVGRITGGSSDDPENLTYQTWKIRMHEMEPYDEGSWFNKAETFGCDGLNGNQTADRWANTIRKGGLECKAYYEGGLSGTGLEDHFNDGLSLWGYKGHGSQTWMSSVNFRNSNVQNLTNGRKLPFISSIGCNNGEYDGYYCIIEALMSEGSIDSPKGALGVLAGTVSMGMTMEDLIEYLWIGMFEEGIWHVSAAETYAKSVVNSTTSDVLHAMIFGDPEVAPFTVSPLPELKVEHGVVKKGPFTVKVTDGTSPVEEALVGIVKKADYERLGSGFTDASGELTLELPDITEDVYITVTHHNCKPYLYEGSTGIATPNGNTLHSFTLGEACPNPFNNATVIRYSLPKAGTIQFDVFTVEGRSVYRKTQNDVQAGSHTLIWDGTGSSGNAVPNGVYLYRITSECGTKVRTCSVMR